MNEEFRRKQREAIRKRREELRANPEKHQAHLDERRELRRLKREDPEKYHAVKQQKRDAKSERMSALGKTSAGRVRGQGSANAQELARQARQAAPRPAAIRQPTPRIIAHSVPAADRLPGAPGSPAPAPPVQTALGSRTVVPAQAPVGQRQSNPLTDPGPAPGGPLPAGLLAALGGAAPVPAAPSRPREGTEPASREADWIRVVKFIQTMKVPDGPKAGTQVQLMDWQIDMIRGIYGPTLVNSDGRTVRAVQKAVMSMGRKNGKTSLAAMLLMCHLIGPVAQWGGQCFSVAWERNQAAIVFNAVCSIIRQDILFPHQFGITDSAKRLYTPWTNSKYQALSAESRSKHGLNPNFVIFDELAQFGTDRELFDVMETSFGAQDQPLMLTISTQADTDDAVLSELIDYGLRVQQGELDDPTFFLQFHTLPDNMDPWDEKNWHLANPGLGVFRSIDEMRNYARKAKESPSAEGPFLNLYHNRRISSVQTAIDKSIWEENAGSWNISALQGVPCWAGLDLSSRTDLTALVLVFEPDGPDGVLPVLPFFWTPKNTLAVRAERDKVPYEVWEKQHFLEAPEGTAIDYGYVAKRIAQIETTFHPHLIGFDRWRMDVLTGWFKEINLELNMEAMGQGYKDASLQIEALEEALLNRRLAHAGHPVLRYSALGAKIIKDPAGGRKFDKSKSTSRIDGLVALAMALRAREVWHARQKTDANKGISAYQLPSRAQGLVILG